MKIFNRLRSASRKAWLKIKINVNNLRGYKATVKIGRNLTLGKDVKITLKRGAKLQIGNNVTISTDTEVLMEENSKLAIGDSTNIFQHTLMQTSKDAALKIGRSCIINRFSTIHAHKSITIGDFALIAEAVSIRDNDKDYKAGKLLYDADLLAEPVEIGKDVWLGAKVTVVKGVKVGDRTIVGANAVVTKDLPGGYIYGGIPAKEIKKR